jgi:hypothetical protein
MVAKPASAIAISIARVPNIGRATDKAAYMTVRMGGRDAAANVAAAKSWRVSNVRSVMHAATPRESTGASKTACVAACKATVATTAESAGMAAASESAMAATAAAMSTAAATMSTATAAVLSKCGGTYGQKRREGTDGPQ